MNQFKKIHSKIFKKSSAVSKSHRDPKLRYSRSMPLRSSNDTDESYIRPRPIYRGEHSLQPTDIQHVFDISQEQAARYEDPHGGWPQYNKENDDGDLHDTEGPYHQRFPLIDRNIVDQFPAPPPTTVKALQPGVGIPKRPARPPTIDLAEFQFDAADLLPEMSPTLKAKIDAIDAENRRIEDEARGKSQARDEAHRALHGRGPLQRSASSASGHARPLNISRHRAVDNTDNSVSTPQPGAGMYRQPAASNSTRSLDPHARYRTCLASSRQAAAKHSATQSTTSTHSGNSVYSNAANSRSTHSLGPNARYRAALASSAAETAQPMDGGPATVRRRNASSASSRSALSARRNGMVAARTGTPPPSEQLAHQALGPNHPDVMRVVRGPHGSKLQCPSPVRPSRDMGLKINDATGKEWGVGGSGGARGAATVAGYGRGPHGHRR